MFIIYNGFVLFMVVQMSIYGIILCPIITLYIFSHLIIQLILHCFFLTVYNILKNLNLIENYFIKNTLLFKSKINPLHNFDIMEKSKYFKNNHINKIVNVTTYNDNIYEGELKYIMDSQYVRVDYIYIKYSVVKDIKLNSMYGDIYNYRLSNIKNNFPVHIPEEINDIIESYVFTKPKIRKEKYLDNFSAHDEIFSSYVLYASIDQYDYEFL